MSFCSTVSRLVVHVRGNSWFYGRKPRFRFSPEKLQLETGGDFEKLHGGVPPRLRNAQGTRKSALRMAKRSGASKWELRLKFELYDRRYDEETSTARSRSVEITATVIRGERSVFYYDENIMRGYYARAYFAPSIVPTLQQRKWNDGIARERVDRLHCRDYDDNELQIGSSYRHGNMGSRHRVSIRESLVVIVCTLEILSELSSASSCHEKGSLWKNVTRRFNLTKIIVIFASIIPSCVVLARKLQRQYLCKIKRHLPEK